jgi:hypothetical protein
MLVNESSLEALREAARVSLERLHG